ncbi:MAG: hypothetical protein LQ346_000858 [Caloplaca aetnensis]|nr:MAG: hypothetical protein LQ346_000858 [Caloplaca aetnensis]
MAFQCGSGGPDCTLYKHGAGCGRFHADSDIAGIGVVVAFVSSSLFNLAIGFLAHTFGILRGYDDNAIDGWIFRKLQSVRWLQIKNEHKGFWRAVTEKIVLVLSDYQLLFGIAILVAGLWKHCSISAYHFSLVVDLAWFSNTHLTSLSILRCYLQERPTMRNWRCVGVVLMAIMMLVVLTLASSPNWNSNVSCPAQCLFQEPTRNLSLTYPYYVAIMLHYSTSIWRVYETPRFDRIFLQYPRRQLQKIGRYAKRTNSDGPLNRSNHVGILHAQGAVVAACKWLPALVIRFYLAVAAILGSLTISLYYDIVWFSIGLTGIMETRAVPGKDMDGDENALGFGQIIPVLLLASILLTFKEVYTGTREAPENQKEHLADL